MKVKKIVDNTINRSEFNRAYKTYLERTGKIHCSYCGYHNNENSKKKWYGGFIYDNIKTYHGKRKETNIKYPNWKLVSKNPKQWMDSSIKVVTKTICWSGKKYIDITW